MGILAVMNAMNGGKGIRMLTEAGSEALNQYERAEKRLRKIHWNKDVSEEEWYQGFQQWLLSPEFEGKFWAYAQVRRCQ
jgi:hypothetical protein